MTITVVQIYSCRACGTLVLDEYRPTHETACIGVRPEWADPSRMPSRWDTQAVLQIRVEDMRPNDTPL